MLRRSKKESKTPTKRLATLSPEKIRELIQTRAYEIYCQRGNAAGDQTSDWLVAETQVRKELRV